MDTNYRPITFENFPKEHFLFFKSNVEVDVDKAINISIDSKMQSERSWKPERSKRITASNAYSLYTYASNKSPNWESKAIKYLKEFGGNAAYGIATEPKARKCYEKMYNISVYQCGLLVMRLNSWLGCSLDGLVVENNEIIKSIEIKCRKEGKNQPIEEV